MACFLIAAGNDNSVTFLGQCYCSGSTDAGQRACDKNDGGRHDINPLKVVVFPKDRSKQAQILSSDFVSVIVSVEQRSRRFLRR
jgi:hypothetical protein